MFFGVIIVSFWMILFPCESKAQNAMKITTEHKISVKVSVEDQKLIFDWSLKTKSALVKVGDKWWLIFDKKAQEFYLPRDRDLPNGIISLKNQFDQPATDELTIFELNLSDGYEFEVVKKDNTWAIEVKEISPIIDLEEQKKTDHTLQRLKKIALIERQWPSIYFKILTKYKITHVDNENTGLLYTFILTDEGDLGCALPYSVPYFNVLKSKQGAGIQRFSSHVSLQQQDGDKVFITGLHSPAPLQGLLPTEEQLVLFNEFSEIFKPLSKDDLKKEIKKLKEASHIDKVDPFTHIIHAWLLLLKGDENRALSFIGLAGQYYPGIDHHPFIRSLKSVYYILDHNFNDAKKALLFLPCSPEIELFRGIISASMGLPKEQISRLRCVVDLQKMYPQKFREEFMIQAIFALLESRDYLFIIELFGKMPPAKSPIFMPFYTYALSFAKSALNKDMFAIENLRNLLETENKNNILNVQLKAHILFAICISDLNNKKITPKEAIPRLFEIQFMWRGDYLELNILNLLTSLLIEEEQYVNALQLLARMRENFSEVFRALHFDKRMEVALTRLFTTKQYKKLSPLKVISIFEEFRTYLPDTEVSSSIIKNIGNLLLELDLLDQAAELLSKESRNTFDASVLSELYIKIAKIHVDNKNGEAALSVLKKIPAPKTSELKEEIINLQAMAYAVLKDIDKALNLLESRGEIKGFQQAAELLIRHKMWREAHDRLLNLIIKFENEDDHDIKMDCLLKLAMVNVLLEENDENQVLSEVYKDFISKQDPKKRQIFEYLTDDTEFTDITRKIIENQLSTTHKFKTVYDQILNDKDEKSNVDKDDSLKSNKPAVK